MEEEKEVKEKKKVDEIKPKRPLLIAIVAIVVSLVSIGLCRYSLSSLGGGYIRVKGAKAKVVLDQTKQIQYEKYDNGLVSFMIPKGWRVDVAPVDYIHYSFRAYDPNNKDYMFIFGLKLEGFLKSEKARSTYAGLYPDAVFSKLAAIDPQTTEGFYKVWNHNAKLCNEIDIKYEYFPYLNDFTVVDNLGSNPLGGDVLRATFKNSEGKAMQGLFTANVKSIGTYYINTDIFNLFSEKVDVSPLNVYNINMMMTPDAEFNNWQQILDNCISTIEFSSTFVSGFNKEESTLVSTIQANQKVYDSISDMIMDSWEKRNNSYDIISQKQSDATLGYERVYDTETGEIYKAYNGFTDDYSGNRCQAITDDMYTSPTSGYIEKVN